MKLAPAYETQRGAAYCGDSLDLIETLEDDSVNLVFTSPPFALSARRTTGILTRTTTSSG